jgi:hypothetical protein
MELSPCFWLSWHGQPIANYTNHRFPLRLRHVEEMLLERGIAVPNRES